MVLSARSYPYLHLGALLKLTPLWMKQRGTMIDVILSLMLSNQHPIGLASRLPWLSTHHRCLPYLTCFTIRGEDLELRCEYVVFTSTPLLEYSFSAIRCGCTASSWVKVGSSLLRKAQNLYLTSLLVISGPCPPYTARFRSVFEPS